MATDVNEIEFASKENRVLHLLKMFGASVSYTHLRAHET